MKFVCRILKNLEIPLKRAELISPKIPKNSLKIKISKYIMFKIFFNDKLAMKFVCRILKILEIYIEARFSLS